ncbi:Spy/CpxP family protein refolding chaperone [Inquilinus sp. OTU3971]|uniref:Spy/CpxP family protein refolding chaperone n=1 Tax=Inquilinus sp. OTU3971 TaxID=3043855 RepID=UPI00313D6105
MRAIDLIASSFVLMIASAAIAQEHTHGAGETSIPTPRSPYAGLQQRTIKALADQQIADLRAGRGAGLALAAELNGYPGPSHVLELADQLALSPDQRTQVATAFAAMKDETSAIGRQVVSGEADLDRLFAGRMVTPENLNETVLRIVGAQGRLRAAHLRYHLLMTTILTPEQVANYAQLRGYAPGKAGLGSGR